MRNSFIKKNTNNKIIVSILSIGLLVLVIGFSYAFFIYNKTGLYTHTINGGKMKVIYDETTGNNITIENAYPLTDEESETKSLEFEFTITGYNESDKNVYYAIEIDHGEDVSGKNRFLDTDMKLTLYENAKEVFKNEIFSNLDNQDIYYNYFKAGTSSQSPTINNYKLRIWINDYVIISDTLSNNLNDWSDLDWNYLYEKNRVKYEEIYNGDDMYLSDYGISIYTSDEFANSYTNFKVNVRADLTYDDFGYITYDANGGTNAPEKTSVLTGMVTRSSPYNVTKVNGQTIYNACIGWSSDPNAEVPEYKPGDYYNGEGELLFAVYSSDINVMKNLVVFKNYYSQIKEIYFMDETEENIDTRYNASSIKYDLTYNNQGRVLGWLENDYFDDATSKQYYKLYIGSEGITYLSTGNYLFGSFNSYSFSNLVSVIFENLNTSLVTDMNDMFSRCSSLTSLDVSNFDTSNVTKMDGMFSNCSSLTSLDVSNFDTSNVEDMSSMFYGCKKLSSLDITKFNTENLLYVTQMFSNCINLKTIDLKYFNTSRIIRMNGLFSSCTGIEELDLSSFNTSNVEIMGGVSNDNGLFENCINIKKLDLSNFDTSKVTNMARMFYGCQKLIILNIKKLNTCQVTDMSGMFWRCYEIENLDISNFDTSNVTNMLSMFEECKSLTNLDLSNFDTSKVTIMNEYDDHLSFGRGMFVGCVNLQTLNISSFDFSNVNDLSYMFKNCKSLINMNLSNFNNSNVTNIASMFYGCSSLITLDLSPLVTNNVTNMSCMFYGCSGLTALDLSNFNTSNTINMNSMFYGCSGLTALDLSNFNTSNTISMNGMFCRCSGLTVLDISNFDTSKATDTRYMFENCTNLITIYSNSDWNTGSVTSYERMFTDCWKLVGAVTFDSSKTDITMANPDTGYFTRKI